jgi:tetratricopeptide (TPR) repeat protein
VHTAPETSDGLVGRRVGPYLLLERLGGGAMGTVYRARDLFLGRTVALKVHKRRRNEQGLRRFLQEARAAEALSHPNVSRTLDAGSEGDLHYLATELVSGMTLAAIVRGGPLPWPDALEIALQMSAGLRAAHAAGVMHRDVKPSNVMIGREGTVRLVDFGLAKQIAALDPGEGPTIVDWQSVQTSPGAVLGTPAYMAPEQASGRPVDARTDVFAFGVTLWETLAGTGLFRRPSPAQTLRAILSDAAPRLDVAAPGTPPWLAEVIARCVEKEPLLRYADAAMLWHALEEGRQREGEGARADLAGLVLRSIGPRISLSPPPSMPTAFPAVARHVTRQGNFVGRIEELNRLDALLARGAPLVSLVGPGGVGKTRLAAEYALRESGEPIVWVELAGLTREAQLVEAVALALGLSERDVRHDRIERRLAERAGGLVVLDGFERLTSEGVAALSRWTQPRSSHERAGRRTQFLVTSRVRMPIAGDEAIALGGLASDEALELFAAHLERHAPGVHVEAASLEALVSSLEGNPLALGLSAARVAADGMPAVLDRMARTTLILDSRDDALAEGAPLRTALGASLQLLSPVEQHLLVSLAVFDTFDVASAEALLEAPRERKIGELLRDLVAGGLLRSAPHPDQLAVSRFALEDAVRTLAERELDVRGDRDTLEMRHAAYFANMATRWMDLLRTDPARESWRELLAERGNLFLAGRRALVARTELFLGFGLRAVSAYAIAARERSGDRAHVPLLAALLEAGEARGAPNGAVHAEALLAYAQAIESRDEARAETQLGRALEIATWSASPALGARIHAARAELRMRAGRVTDAIEDSRRAALVAERLASAPELEAALLSLVHAHAISGDLGEAEQALVLAQRLAGARDDAHSEARLAILEGDLHVERGELVLGARVLERALELAAYAGNLKQQCEISLRLAELAHRAGLPEEARARYAVAARHAKETNDPRQHGRVMLGMGELELDEERFQRALSLFREAQLELAGIVEPRGEVFALAAAAATLATMGALEDGSAELTRATLLARSLDVASQRVVGVWAGFLDLAVHPGEEGIARAKGRLGRISFPPGAEIVAPPLVREAFTQAALVLGRRIRGLEVVLPT